MQFIVPTSDAQKKILYY